MDHTPVDVKRLKTLEDLAVHLSTALYSLMTLHNFEIRAIEIGIMKEDMNERANTIAWDLKRLMKIYKTQLEEVLDLLPDDFNPNEAIKKLQKQNVRNAKKKKDDNT
jgi:hypothetical protein